MKVIPVTKLENVDPTRYIEGNVFISSKQVGILHQGKIDPLVKQSDLRGYIKKTEVVKLIDAAVKKVSTDG